MPPVVDVINQIAYDATQAYLLRAQDLTEFIKTAAVANGLNNEMIKRVCEQANKNTYLGQYHNANVDRSNIVFPYADFDRIKSAVNDEDTAMKDYGTSPDDYRMVVEKTASAPEYEQSPQDKARDKHESLQKVAALRDKLRGLRQGMETVKIAGLRHAELCVGRMHELGRNMVANGENYGDIMKIACRHVKAQGYGFEKTASALAYVGEAIAESGLTVTSTMTKISSVPSINGSHPMNVSALGYASELEKVAAANEFISGVNTHIAKLDAIIDVIEQY